MALIAADNINTGDKHAYKFQFRAGITYQIYVQNALPGVDLDIYIFDTNGNLLGKDDSYASDAGFFFTPAWTAEFTVVVTCASGATTYHLHID